MPAGPRHPWRFGAAFSQSSKNLGIVNRLKRRKSLTKSVLEGCFLGRREKIGAGVLTDTLKNGRTLRETATTGELTRVRCGSKTVGQALGEFVKGPAVASIMAAYLALIEDQGNSVGQEPDHGEDNQCGGFVNRGMFEVAVSGDGLESLNVDSPATTAELMDE